MSAQSESELPTGTVTFLFTDIEGSTRLLATLGDAYTSVLERHAAILRAAIRAHAGIEVSTEGDSFFAVFPSAISAVDAVVDAQRALAGAAWPAEAAVRVRMGLHSGEGRRGGDNYVGMDVHAAARIAAAANGGQVLISSATRALVENALPNGATLRDLGRHRLKDLDWSMELWQLDIDGLPRQFPPIRTAVARADNLPSQLTTFVGRDREVATVADLLDQHRLVTLTGPGGAGKTRLAMEVVRATIDRFTDGATFVDLAPIRDPALVALAVSRALRLSVDPGGDALKAAIAHLRDRELLLLLDNFEQVASAADLIERLLAEAPALKVMVTSREALGIYGEQDYEVPPFANAESISLFVNRARAIRPDFTLDGRNAAAVAAIVEHVDGLPLAIELAASQMRVLTPTAVRERFEQHLPLPPSGDHGRPERQRTMRNAIAWSYDILTEDERQIFARVALLPGGFSIPTAEAVADGGDLEGAVLDGLASLVTKSLVRRVETPDGEPRFRMLEPIREFGEQRLRDEFDLDDTSRRLATSILAFAEEASPQLTSREQGVWLDRCEREAPNLRRAIGWSADSGEVEIGLRIATAVWRFWQQRGPMWEGRRILDRLLATRRGTDSVRGRALGAAGGIAWWEGDFEAARLHYEAALPLLEHGDDRLAEASALYDVAFIELWQAVLGGGLDANRAEELFGRSLAIADELGDRRGRARALRGLGQVRGIVRADPAGALPLFRESLSIAEEIGDRWEMNESVIAVGNGLRFSGDLASAKRAYLSGVDLMAEAANTQAVNGLLFLLAALESQMGDHERVVRLWGAAEASREASGAIAPPSAGRLIGDPVATARAAIGDVAVERGLAEGRAMDPAAIVPYAHAHDGSP